MARPREFDADEALDKAMRLFWAKGYHDSSIRDLVERTGVNYYGLYEVFKNKHGLLIAALDRYRGTITSEFGSALKEAEPTAAGLLEAFERLFDLMTTEDGQVGCLMCNCASELAARDEMVAAKVRAHLDHLADLFDVWLLRQDSARSKSSRRQAAEALASNVYSFALLLRTGFSRTEVRRRAKALFTAML